MTLGEYITRYREKHPDANGRKMSRREFASRAGLSRTHINNIERGLNNDGKPISPTLDVYAKVAKATGLSVDELILSLNDNVTLNAEYTDTEKELVRLFRLADERDQDVVFNILLRYDSREKEKERTKEKEKRVI